MQYTLKILGVGAEINQEYVLEDLAREILNSSIELDIDIEEYYYNTHTEYEIIDSTELTAPYLQKSLIQIYCNDSIIYSSECKLLNCISDSYETFEPYESISGNMSVISTIDEIEGEFYSGTFEADSFDPESLSLRISIVNQSKLITGVQYNQMNITNCITPNVEYRDLYKVYIDI